VIQAFTQFKDPVDQEAGGDEDDQCHGDVLSLRLPILMPDACQFGFKAFKLMINNGLKN
jgi:hypothetical protein